jgi:hypothetical protein
MAVPHLGHRWSSKAESNGVTAGSQLFRGTKPILLRRSFGTAPRLPQLLRERGDFVMPKWGNAVPGRNRLGMPVRLLRVLQGVAGMLMPGQVLGFSALLGYPVGVRCNIV